MAGPEKQRTKFNQGTKAFWTSLMDKAKQDFDRDLGEEDFERGLAKKRKKTSPRKSKKGAYSLEEAMTNLAARAKAVGLDYERPMKAAQKAKKK